MLAWLVLYQGLPTKSRLSRIGFTDDKCLQCDKLETVEQRAYFLGLSFRQTVLELGRQFKTNSFISCRETFIGVLRCSVTLVSLSQVISVTFGIPFASQNCTHSGRSTISMFLKGQLVLFIAFQRIEFNEVSSETSAKGFMLINDAKNVSEGLTLTSLYS